jgi:anti-sigma regulatory factor (Ser/Thr protein kinase)
MLKNLEYPAERKLLPQMLSTIADEIKKYVKEDKWINLLKVCAEEILINIIDYSKSDKIYISCEFLNNDLRFEFVDCGIPYNPLEKKTEIDIDAEFDERSIGGLGIFLYTTIMDKLEYKFEDGKNHLIAIKNLSEAVN